MAREVLKHGRTVRFNKRQIPNAAKWVEWLENESIASVGPDPSIIGMRKQYWGDSALIVKAGRYAYLIDRKDTGKPLPWTAEAACNNAEHIRRRTDPLGSLSRIK